MDRAEVEREPEHITVLGTLQQHATTAPNALALVVPDTAPVSYGALHAAVQATAEQLRTSGLGAEHRVVVAPRTRFTDIVLLLALLDTATCCPVDPNCSARELTATAADVSASAVLAPEGVGTHLHTAAERLGLPVLEYTPGQAGSDPRSLLLQATLPPASPPRSEERNVLLLRTSGTGGAPKTVPLTADNIEAGAQATVDAYRLGPDDRRLNVMPLFHVQGLVGSVIASLRAGASVVCLDGFIPEEALKAAAQHQVTWFSATPTMHRMLLDASRGMSLRFERLRFVRCGSAHLPSQLRREMEAAYQVPVVESYGMSEAHQIASTPFPPGTAIGMVPTGSSVALLVNGRVETRSGRTGELLVRGANVAARRLTPSGLEEAGLVDGWFRTGDVGVLHEDGSLTVTGRIRDLINRGGEKIAPREVEDALLEHPAVGQVAVFAVPDRVTGEQAAAAVVPRSGMSVTEGELRSFLSGRLSPHKIPHRILMRAALPSNATGKLQRAGLAAALAPELSSYEAQAGEPPHDAWEAALAGLWAHALRRPLVGRDEDFFDSGGDSLAATLLLSTIHDIMGVRVTAVEFHRQASTVEAMARLLRDRRSSRPVSPGHSCPA
ncbi:non-ribosomal peptide synthetase [Streptomyces sp. CL12]|uniref:non-ribosomal peptide synthetase n=1 Tax=Streptomyces sp. CL12 TaxID=3391744 RepID=UPI003A812562